MLREDGMREVLVRLQRGERIKGVARNTVKRWQRLGGWRPRPSGHRPCQIDPYRRFVASRGPEVVWNGRVLHRELQALGFAGVNHRVEFTPPSIVRNSPLFRL